MGEAPWMDDPEEMHSRAPKATTARMSVSTRGASASRRWFQIAAPPPPTMVKPREPALDEQLPDAPPPAPPMPVAPPPPELNDVSLDSQEWTRHFSLETEDDLASQR